MDRIMVKSSKRALVLHVGLPKTGSTALQFWCHKNRAFLADRGISYPAPSENEFAPKHQFVVNGLLKQDFTELRAALRAQRTPVVILSSEGISNHFARFEPSALAKFREITRNYDVHVLMMARDPEAWTKSLWKEGLLATPGYAFGLEKYATLPRVQRLTQHELLLEKISRAFGAVKTTLARFEDGWTEALLSVSGMDPEAAAMLQDVDDKNVSISDDLCEIIRQVNAQRLQANLRGAILGLIQERLQTRHNRLVAALSFLPASPKQVEKIKSIFGSLELYTDGQRSIRDSLVEGCNDRT